MGSHLPKQGEIWQLSDDDNQARYLIHGVIEIKDRDDSSVQTALPQIILYQRVDSDGNFTGSNIKAITVDAWQVGTDALWKKFGDDWWSWE